MRTRVKKRRTVNLILRSCLGWYDEDIVFRVKPGWQVTDSSRGGARNWWAYELALPRADAHFGSGRGL